MNYQRKYILDEYSELVGKLKTGFGVSFVFKALSYGVIWKRQ